MKPKTIHLAKVEAIELGLEYDSYPVWVLVNDEQVYEHTVFDEIRRDKALSERLERLQAAFNALYFDENQRYDPTRRVRQEEWEQVLKMSIPIRKEVEERFCGRYPMFDVIGQMVLVDGHPEVKLEFRLSLEYGCYPVWIIIGGGEIDEHPVFDEIAGDPVLDKLLDELQDEYDATFYDENNKFDVYSPMKPEVWESICKKANLAVRMVKARFGGRYAIVDYISKDFPPDGKDGI